MHIQGHKDYINFYLVDSFINGICAIIFINTEASNVDVTQGHQQWYRVYTTSY